MDTPRFLSRWRKSKKQLEQPQDPYLPEFRDQLTLDELLEMFHFKESWAAGFGLRPEGDRPGPMTLTIGRGLPPGVDRPSPGVIAALKELSRMTPRVVQRCELEQIEKQIEKSLREWRDKKYDRSKGRKT